MTMSIPKENSSLLSYKRGNIQSSYSTYDLPLTDHASSIAVPETDYLHGSTEADDEPGIPMHRAVFVISNGALGAGLLSFPYAYGKTGGVIQGLFVQGVLAVLIYGAFPIIGYCCSVKRTANYQDTVLIFCGPLAQTVCQIIVTLAMFGSNVTYFILIGDQLTKVIDQPGWYFDRKIVITVVACTCILPLCIPKKLKVISYSSFFGGVGGFFVSIVVLSRYYSGGYTHETSSSSEFHWTSAMGAVPILCYAFQCHLPSVAVFAEMHNPTMKRFSIVTLISMIICNVIYCLTGAYGFLTFGHRVKSDILVNYHPSDEIATMGRAVIVVVVFSTYAIAHFVGRSAFLGLWVKVRHLGKAEIEIWQNQRRIVTSLVWFFCSLGLATVVPDIGKAIAIVGGLAAHFIFTFPGLCLIQLMLSRGETLTFKKAILLFVGVMYAVIGNLLCAQSVALAIKEDIQNKS